MGHLLNLVPPKPWVPESEPVPSTTFFFLFFFWKQKASDLKNDFRL